MEFTIRNSVLGVLFILLMGCGAATKTVAPSAKSKALDDMVMAKRFEIDVEWVRPLMTNSLNNVISSGLYPPGNTVGQINVMGSGNFLKMEDGIVSADLPYFGERQMGGGYNSHTGIEFEGEPKRLEISKNYDKQSYQVNFTITEETESYQVRLDLSSQLKGTLSISSSQRRVIRYEGKVSALKETK